MKETESLRLVWSVCLKSKIICRGDTKCQVQKHYKFKWMETDMVSKTNRLCIKESCQHDVHCINVTKQQYVYQNIRCNKKIAKDCGQQKGLTYFSLY